MQICHGDESDLCGRNLNTKKYAYVRDKISNAHFSHVMHEIEPICCVYLCNPETDASALSCVLLFRADLLASVIGQKGGAHQRPTDVDS
jgi:dolichol kinase